MRVPRVALLILSVLMLFTGSIGLRYVTARARASGEQTCVQYLMMDSNYDPYYVVIDSATGDTLRTRTKPFFRTIPYIDSRGSSPDGKWMIQMLNEPTNDDKGRSTLWIMPLRFGLPIIKEAAIFSLSVMSGGSGWSSDSRTIVTEVVTGGNSPHVRELIITQLDDQGAWKTSILNTNQVVQEWEIPSLVHTSPWDGKTLITSAYEGTGILHKRWDVSTLTEIDSIQTPAYRMASLSADGRLIGAASMDANGQGEFTVANLDTKQAQTISIPAFSVVRALVWDKHSEWVALVTDGESTRDDNLHVFGVNGTVRLNVISRKLDNQAEEEEPKLLRWTLEKSRLIYDTGNVYDRHPIVYDPVIDSIKPLTDHILVSWWQVVDDAERSHFYLVSNSRIESEVLRGHVKVDIDTGETVPLLSKGAPTEPITNPRFLISLNDSYGEVENRVTYRSVTIADVVTGTSKSYSEYNGVPFKEIQYSLGNVYSNHYFFIASLSTDSGSYALYKIDPLTQTISQLTAPVDNLQALSYLHRDLWAVVISTKQHHRAILFDAEGFILGDFALGTEFEADDLRRMLILPDPTDAGIPYIAFSRLKNDVGSDFTPYIVHNNGQKYPLIAPRADYDTLAMQWLPNDELLATKFVKHSVGSAPPQAHTIVTDRYGNVKYSTVLDYRIGASSEGQWSACR